MKLTENQVQALVWSATSNIAKTPAPNTLRSLQDRELVRLPGRHITDAGRAELVERGLLPTMSEQNSAAVADRMFRIDDDTIGLDGLSELAKEVLFAVIDNAAKELGRRKRRHGKHNRKSAKRRAGYGSRVSRRGGMRGAVLRNRRKNGSSR